jgi:hypothetical protein
MAVQHSKECLTCGVVIRASDDHCTHCGAFVPSSPQDAAAAGTRDAVEAPEDRDAVSAVKPFWPIYGEFPSGYGWLRKEAGTWLQVISLLLTISGLFLVPGLTIASAFEPFSYQLPYFKWLSEAPFSHGFQLVLVMAALVLAGSFCGSLRVKTHEKHFADVTLEDEREFVFILRPFERGHFDRMDTDDILLDGRKVRRPHSVVEVLERELSSHYGIVLLRSQPNYVSSFSKSLVLHSSSHWKEWFKFVAEHSKAIVVLPDLTPGLVHELEQIALNGWIGRTVVIITPCPKYQTMLADRQYRWEAIRTLFRFNGWELPEYEGRGAVVVFDAAGHCTTSAFGSLVEILASKWPFNGHPISSIAAVASSCNSDSLPPGYDGLRS